MPFVLVSMWVSIRLALLEVLEQLCDGRGDSDTNFLEITVLKGSKSQIRNFRCSSALELSDSGFPVLKNLLTLNTGEFKLIFRLKGG